MRTREKIEDLSVAIIDNNFASAFSKDNTSYGRFPATSAKQRLRGETTREAGFDEAPKVRRLHSGSGGGRYYKWGSRAGMGN